MKTRGILKILLLLIIAGCSNQRETSDSKLQVSLDELIIKEHEANKFDGVVTIGTKDTVLYQKAIGTANRVWNIPMRTNHIFDICSLNKSFVATLILMAVEEGKLSLDDTLTELLKEFPYTGEFNPTITIHQMLTHTSGLSDYGQVEQTLLKDNARLFKRKHFTDTQYVDFISKLPMKGKVGRRFYYSNFAYHLLSIILEDVYEQSFPELLNNKICQPLGLKNTFGTVSNTDIFENLVEAYNYNEIANSWNRNQFIDLTLGRRIFSSSQDLYLWGKEMSSGSLLSTESVSLMQTNHTKNINPDISYGYGWAVFDGKGEYRMGDLGIDRKYIIHGGATEGYRSMLVNIEDGQYIIAFLSNIGDRTDEIGLTKSIINILINSENEK